MEADLCDPSAHPTHPCFRVLPCHIHHFNRKEVILQSSAVANVAKLKIPAQEELLLFKLQTQPVKDSATTEPSNSEQGTVPLKKA